MKEWQVRLQQHQQSFSSQSAITLDLAKAYLASIHDELNFAFHEGAEIGKLLLGRSDAIDCLLQNLWRAHELEAEDTLTLVAVGGYGRAEMHPESDIDLMILLQDEPDQACQEKLSALITLLWDLKLEIGHSVRTFVECQEEAKNDLTIITNLIESRFLCGNEKLIQDLHETITTEQMWDSQHFFKAKLGEQKHRYKKYGDTAYRVEPNLKDGPGGLRDLQMISWVTARHFGTLSFEELLDEELLQQHEYDQLISDRDFLWRVRFALHLVSNRKEDRLRLEHQRPLAKIFGYTSDQGNKAVEEFMHDYYQVITRLERLTELLIGIFRETILPNSDAIITKISDWCEMRDSYINITQADIFEKQPSALLEIFHLMQTTSGSRGMTPSTIRSINDHLPMIDDEYRDNPEHKAVFMKIMSEPHGITYVLRRMNRYSILAAWIPAFANIVGRMQFDLFHAYTVDDHTLRLIRNLRQHTTDKGQNALPFSSLIFNTIPNHSLLYLAGIFHDIAKGRGGDHSELGAVDAYEFCRSHNLNSFDSHLVSWLVKNHLVMSMTAQRKDLSDPNVIAEFATHIVSPTRLDYLYLLTIADMRATNPEMFNSWKASLLKELYEKTRRMLKRGIAPADYEELLAQKKEAVLEQLPIHKTSKDRGAAFCESMGNEYILHHSVDTILWQMMHILQENVYPLIQIRQEENRTSTLVFIYTPVIHGLFARTTKVLETLKLNTVAAYIMGTPNGFALETFNILGRDNQLIEDADEQLLLINRLREKITLPVESKTELVRPSHRLDLFHSKTRVSFKQDTERQVTIVTIRTLDIPGLLSRISEILYKLDLQVISARIATLGEEAEDLFYLTDRNDKPITDEETLRDIEQQIIELLDSKTEAA